MLPPPALLHNVPLTAALTGPPSPAGFSLCPQKGRLSQPQPPRTCSPHTGCTLPASTQSQEACGHTCAHTQTHRRAWRYTETLRGLRTCVRAHTHTTLCRGPQSVLVSLCSAYILRVVCSVLMKHLSPHKQSLTDKMAQTLSLKV